MHHDESCPSCFLFINTNFPFKPFYETVVGKNEKHSHYIKNIEDYPAVGQCLNAEYVITYCIVNTTSIRPTG